MAQKNDKFPFSFPWAKKRSTIKYTNCNQSLYKNVPTCSNVLVVVETLSLKYACRL